MKQALASVEVWLKRSSQSQFNGLIGDILPVLVRAWFRALKASGVGPPGLETSQSSPPSAERAAPVEADAVEDELMAAISNDETD